MCRVFRSGETAAICAIGERTLKDRLLPFFGLASTSSALGSHASSERPERLRQPQRRHAMHSKSKIVLALVAGVALGAAAVQGLHAQAKPKAYLVTESEVLDPAALSAYLPQVRQAAKAAGGTLDFVGPSEKIVAVVGEAPKRIGVSEWESLEKAQAWIGSPERKALTPQRDKAQKITRQFIVEGK
jgi:uncharacterized protein (DUF1330 family)